MSALPAGPLAAALSILCTGCPCGVGATSRCEARCVIVASPAAPGPRDSRMPPGAAAQPLPGAPPQLTPFSANPVAQPVRVVPYRELPLLCGRADSDDPVDDRDALLHGGGLSDGQPRKVCPAFPTTLTSEPAALTAPPCGPSACPNVQLRAEQQGTQLHFLFYDSPGAHTPERPCYYRLHAVSVSWEGKAP